MQTPVLTALSTINQLAAVYQFGGRWQAARQLLEQGIALANDSTEHNLAKLALQNRLADILWKQGNTDQAESTVQAAKTIAEMYQDQQTLADSLYHLGEIAYIRHYLMGLGEQDTAYQLHQQALVIRETAQDIVGIIQSLSRIGVLHERQREYEAALTYYQKSVELGESTDNQQTMTRALNHIGVHHQRNGDLKTALTYYRHSLTINQASGNVELLLFALDLVGEATYDLHHNFEETYTYYQQALEIAEQLDFKLAIIRTLFLLATLYADNSSQDRAIETYQRIVHIAKPINYQALLKPALAQIAQLQSQ